MNPLHIPKHGLNIQRSQLPQIKSTDISEFIEWLKHTKHITVTHADFPVASLYPSQGEFNQVKIRELMKDKREHLKKPVIISADHYLLDGHHRWLALLNMDNKDTIPAIVVHMKILDLLAAAKEFPKSFTKTVVESFTKFNEPHEVLAFGRMNPPTAGHEKVVNMVHQIGLRLGLGHVLQESTHRATELLLMALVRVGVGQPSFFGIVGSQDTSSGLVSVSIRAILLTLICLRCNGCWMGLRLTAK